VSIVVMGAETLLYTWIGGLRAVVWADVLQLTVYVTGGILALGIAWDLAGGPTASLAAAATAGKLRLIVTTFPWSTPYTLTAGLLGGALLSAASHGTDHLIVQRLLATRSLGDARLALVGSGVVVILQFTLFLLLGVAIWSAGGAPEGVASDAIFPRFILDHLPVGVSGLLIAGILAAAMSTISSSINALAGAVTHDFWAPLTGLHDPATLLRVGRRVSLVWGVGLMGAALGFDGLSRGLDTPVVVLALSIASVTYGALLGTYLLAARWPRARGRDVVVATLVSVSVMLVVVFAARLSPWPPLAWLDPVGRLAWPWYVPLGTALTVVMGTGSSLLPIRGTTRTRMKGGPLS